jgi:serine/threonine protein kinase
MDLMERGSLRQLLRQRGASLTLSEKMNLSLQCTHAVHYLHKLPEPIIHRDIKSDNFLIDSSGRVKLGEQSRAGGACSSRSRRSNRAAFQLVAAY